MRSTEQDDGQEAECESPPHDFDASKTSIREAARFRDALDSSCSLESSAEKFSRSGTTIRQLF